MRSVLLLTILLAAPVRAEDAPAETSAAPDQAAQEAVADEATGEAAEKTAGKTAEEIRSCARGNFPEKTSVQTIVMIAHDRSGGQRTLKAKMYWRQDDKGFSNVMIRVYAPGDLSGSSYLVLEREERDDMFMYLPALDRVRRIVGNMRSKPLWGTDLSYEDIKHLHSVAMAGSMQRLEDGKVGEREVYVLESDYEQDLESPYKRVVSSIDKVTCTLLEASFYDDANEAIKKLSVQVDTLMEVDGRWQMRDMKMEDLHNQTHTELKVEEIESDESISGRVFSSHTFHMGG